MGCSIAEIIWCIMKWILEGMSRESAISRAASEFGVDIEEIRRRLS